MIKKYKSLFENNKNSLFESIDAVCPVCDEHLGYMEEMDDTVLCGNCGTLLRNEGDVMLVPANSKSKRMKKFR